MRINRSAVVLTSAAASLLLLATPALAHVTVQGPGATQGGFTKLTFRVPTEKPVATTKLEIQFPADAPLAFVSIKPHAGWTVVVKKAKPAVEVKDFEGNALDRGRSPASPGPPPVRGSRPASSTSSTSPPGRSRRWTS